MDDQHDYPTDDTEKLRLILLQLDYAGREEVFAMIRELAAKGDTPGQPVTVAELFEQWTELRQKVDATSDEEGLTNLVHQTYHIERRAVALPLTSVSIGSQSCPLIGAQI